MKVLVTGGAGFIGSTLIDKLLEIGYSVIAIDNFNEYYNPIVKKKNIENALKSPNFKLYKVDIKDKQDLLEIFQKEKPKKIIHLAARAGVRSSIKNPEIYLKDNCLGTLNLLELAKDFSINQFIFASSSSVYGDSTEIPFSEFQQVDKPISPYATTKKAGELLCYTYSHLYDLNIICLRFFTVYGPRGRPDMAIYKFIDQIYNEKNITLFGSGNTKRDYTFISDIVDGIVKSLQKEKKFTIYNLGNSQTIKLLDLVKTIEKSLEKKAKIKFESKMAGDVDLTYANIEKAKKELGYQPKISIKEGIDKTVDWYLKMVNKK